MLEIPNISKCVLLHVAKAAVKNPGPCFDIGPCTGDSDYCFEFCKKKGIHEGKCSLETGKCCCNNIG